MKFQASGSRSQDEEQTEVPLLQGMGIPIDLEKTLFQKVAGHAFRSSANLAKLLPTGTVLLFQLLSPILTDEGNCSDLRTILTAILIAFCGLSCFLSNFTDSFRDIHGRVCYGVVTCRGLWVIDGSAKLPPELAATYKLKFMDFFHAVLSLMVFTAVALFDGNVVNCFFPQQPEEPVQGRILSILPPALGFVSSTLFSIFPTKRHGFGYTLSFR